MSSQRAPSSSENRSRSIRPPVARAHRRLRHHPADAVGVLSHVAPAHLLEHERLPLLVRGRGISLSDVEHDFAGAQRLEYDGCEAREPQPPLDEPHGEPEPPGDALDVGALFDQLLERQALVGRAHGEPLEVLGEPGLLRGSRSAVDNEAANLVVVPQPSFFGETGQRPKAAPPGSTVKRPFGLFAGATTRFCRSPRASMSAFS
jgi:hypothetical protein